MKYHGIPTAVDGAEIRCGCPPGTNRLIAPLERSPIARTATPPGTAQTTVAEPVDAMLTEKNGERPYSTAEILRPCNHPDRMEELASYIADEMNRNINHPLVLEMKELNSFDPEAETAKYNALPFYLRLGRGPDFHNLARGKQAKAFVLWTERVGQNRPWDHKPKLEKKFGDYWHKQGNYDYYYDIWSNIHYGYVGIIGGLSESILLDGAGAEQIASDTLRKVKEVATKPTEEWTLPGPHPTANAWAELRSWDDVADRVSISVGMKLANRYPGGGVTAKVIMLEVLAVIPTNWGKGVRFHVCN